MKHLLFFTLLTVLMISFGCKSNSTIGPLKNKVVVAGEEKIYVIEPKIDKIVSQSFSGENPLSFVYKKNKLFVLNNNVGAGTIPNPSLSVFEADRTSSSKLYDDGVQRLASHPFSNKIIAYYDEAIGFYIDSSSGKITNINRREKFLGFIKRKYPYLATADFDSKQKIILRKEGNLKIFKSWQLKFAPDQAFQLTNDKVVFASIIAKRVAIVNLLNYSVIYKAFPIEEQSDEFPWDDYRLAVQDNKLYSVSKNSLYILNPNGSIEIKHLPINTNQFILNGDRIILLDVKYTGISDILRKAILYDLERKKVLGNFKTSVDFFDFTGNIQKLYFTDAKRSVVHVFDFNLMKKKTIKTEEPPLTIYLTPKQ